MASYRSEREQFIVRMTKEGLDLSTTLALLRAATTLQRYAELACSSEAADRDRVPCPASPIVVKGRILVRRDVRPCLCDHYNGDESPHETITRITLREYQLVTRLGRAVPANWAIDTQGDPRGYVLRVIPPSYAERNQGRDRFNRDTIGVPSGPTGLRF